MEPNKLENNFREQLNRREIQPSEMAWDRLDAMLSVAENKKPKKRTWLYIAASFLGFMLIGSLFFNQSETEIKTNDAVVVQENTKSQTENTSQDQTSPVSSSTITAVQPNQKAIASVTTSSKKGSKATTENSSISEKGTEEVQLIEEIKPVVKSNRYIESESLLAEAETKLQTESIKSSVAKSGVKVNSKNLLNSVEGELDDTFRERVVRSIGKNYETVKSSLATRNQE